MKRLVFLFVFCGILAGCDRDLDISELDREVMVFLSAESLSTSLLKSTATTAENQVSKIILFGVNSQGAIVQKFAAITNPALAGFKLTISKQVTTLYAMANPSTALETAAAAATVTTSAQLTALTNSFGSNNGSMPASPFLMAGTGAVNSSSVNIELIRAVAKIEIKGENGFVITSVTVRNTPNTGYVFKQATTSVPSSGVSRISYSAVSSASPILYVAESGSANPATFDVTGRIDNGASTTYTVTLKVNGSNVSIARNTHYTVSIIPITETECTVIVTIPNWSDVIADPISV